jgi:hypothetical protein
MKLITTVDGFSCFPLNIVFRKLLDMVRTGQKVTISKGDIDGFSYFSLISVILFSNQDLLWLCLKDYSRSLFDLFWPCPATFGKRCSEENSWNHLHPLLKWSIFYLFSSNFWKIICMKDYSIYLFFKLNVCQFLQMIMIN